MIQCLIEFDAIIYINPIRFYKIWEDINIEGVIKDYYSISSFGRLMNINGQILKPQLINSGYLVYKLYTGDNTRAGTRYKTVLVHRLVKETFDPIPNQNNMTVNHDDNLKLYGSGNYQAAFNRDQLKVIVQELQKGTRYKNILQLIGMENTDNNRDYIGNIKRGKTYQKEIRDILNE